MQRLTALANCAKSARCLLTFSDDIRRQPFELTQMIDTASMVIEEVHGHTGVPY